MSGERGMQMMQERGGGNLEAGGSTKWNLMSSAGEEVR